MLTQNIVHIPVGVLEAKAEEYFLEATVTLQTRASGSQQNRAVGDTP